MTFRLHAACRCGRLEAIRQAIAEGNAKGYPPSVTLQQRDPILGAMPLHCAAEHGHLALVHALVRHKACISLFSPSGDEEYVTG